MANLGDITLLILQRNHAALTMAVLQSLRRFEGDAISILVVDDGSRDDALEQIRRLNAVNCRVSAQPPRGVTAAWNAGMKLVETPLVVLLNNDVVIHGAFVERLIRPLRTRQAAMAGVEWRRELDLPERLRSKVTAQELLAGWCLAFETELWSKLGGFDETLRLYFSDTDFQCRTMERNRAGSQTLAVVPNLPLRHLGHRTVRREPARQMQWRMDRSRFLAKWKP